MWVCRRIVDMQIIFEPYEDAVAGATAMSVMSCKIKVFFFLADVS